MKKRLLFAMMGALAFGAVASMALAAGTTGIAFPVAELGGCTDQAACKTYCDDASHSDACLAFAKAHGLVDEAAAARAEAVAKNHGGPGGCADNDACRQYCGDETHQDECTQFAVDHGLMTREQATHAGKPGPGGCRGSACRQYCADANHVDECTQFAVDNGFISSENAARIRQAKQKIKEAGAGPGGCADESACRQYCEDPAHLDACVAFGERHGLIDQEDIRQIKKSGLMSGPGGCQGADACRQYCDDAAHQQECVDWASQNNLLSPNEVAQAKKIAGHTGPGGCRGDQCRAYCAEASHADECLAFAEQNKLISPEDASRAKKFLDVSRQGGPGGCTGDQCRAYCADASHHDECLDFAKKKGLVSDEEIKHFEAGRKIQDTVRQNGGPGGCKDDNACRDYCSDPSHVEECVAFASAHGGVSGEQAQQMLKDFTEQKTRGTGDFNSSQDVKQFQQESDQKFRQFRQLEQQFRGPDSRGFGEGHPRDSGANDPSADHSQTTQDRQSGGHMTGPGGCASPAECIKYCAEHKEECFGGSDRPRQEQGQEQDGICCPRSGDASSGLKLRNGLLREIKKADLPQGFDQLSPDDRSAMLRDKMRQAQEHQKENPSDRPEKFPSKSGEFPGNAPAGFQGRPEEFPGKSIHSPGLPSEGFPQGAGEFRQPPPPPVDGMMSPSSGNFSGGQTPPSGGSGGFMPPPSGGGGSGGFTPPPSGSNGGFAPPLPSGGSGTSAPPPPPPSGFAPIINFFAAASGLKTR